MSRYRITESVGSRVQDVHSYEDLEIHHPSRNALGLRTGRPEDFEPRRTHRRVDGEFEEVRLLPDGRALVKKDFILSHDGRGPVGIPSPVDGYVHYLGDRNATMRIYDRPFGEPGARLLAQALHMDPRTFQLKEGERIAYGQRMGVMSDRGTPGSVHAHVEVEADQFRRYIRDIDTGVITPESCPSLPRRTSPDAGPIPEGAAWSAPDSSVGRTMREGDAGREIGRLQSTLSRLGYGDPVGRTLVADGEFGPDTARAVRAFQREQGLKIDGVVGPRTLEAVERAEAQLLSSPSHPHHTLYTQTLDAVHLMEANRCIASGAHSERLAAALAVVAVRSGLARVDRIELNEQGTLARAVQVHPMRDEATLNRMTEGIDTQQAMRQSVRESSEAMGQAATERQVQHGDLQHQHEHSQSRALVL